jgi:hypothetical protein
MRFLALQTSAGLQLLLWQPGSVLLLIALQQVLVVMMRAPAVGMTVTIQGQVSGLAVMFQRQRQLLLQKHQRALQAASNTRKQTGRRGALLAAATRAQSRLLARLCLNRDSWGRLLLGVAAAALLLLPQLRGWQTVQTAWQAAHLQA